MGCLCVCLLTRVLEITTVLDIKICNLACKELLTNSDHKRTLGQLKQLNITMYGWLAKIYIHKCISCLNITNATYM